ncbi:MAG: hypothetical protein V4726_00825 [Verrucomicrobiota bacterium]
MNPAQIRIPLRGASAPEALGRPVFYRGDDVWVEVALMNPAGTALRTLAGVQSLTLEIYLSDKEEGLLAGQTLTLSDLNPELVLSEWLDGSGQHGRFPLTATQTNLKLGTRQATLWAVVYAVFTGAGRSTLGAGQVIFRDSNAGADGPAGTLPPLYPTLPQLDAFMEKVNALSGVNIATQEELEGEAADRVQGDNLLRDNAVTLESALTIVQDSQSDLTAAVGGVVEGLASQEESVDSLATTVSTQAALIASLSGQVAAAVVGYDYRRALISQLPGTANATSPPRTELALIYGESELVNGLYYREPGNTPFIKMPGDQSARIAAAEAVTAAVTSTLRGMINMDLTGTGFNWIGAAGGGLDTGNIEVHLGLDTSNNLVATFSQALADQVFGRAGAAALAAVGGRLSPRIEDGLIKFPNGCMIGYADIPNATGPVNVDGEGGWWPALGASGSSAVTTNLPARTVIIEVLGKTVAIIWYGQSKSIGADGLPVISTTQPYNAVSFAEGPRAGMLELSQMAPLVENTNPRPDGGPNGGETCCSGTALGINRQFAKTLSTASFPFRLWLSAAGQGSSLVTEIDQNSDWWSLLLAHFQACKALINAEGGNVTCPCVDINIGQTDASESYHTPKDTFKGQISAMTDAIRAAVMTVFGQPFPPKVRFVVPSYNTKNWPDIALAFWELRDDPRMQLIMPDYWLTTDTGLHEDAPGYKQTGLVAGDVFYKYFVQHLEWIPTQPYSAVWQARTASLYFKGPLHPFKFDDGIMVGLLNHGIQLADTAGILTISSMTWISANCLEIITARDKEGAGTITGGLALTRSTAGFTNGCIGIRDSSEETEDGLAIKHYCIPFKFDL